MMESGWDHPRSQHDHEGPSKGKEDRTKAEGRLYEDLMAIADLGMKGGDLQARNVAKECGEMHRHEFP